jgi:hypothetical protein
MTRTSLRPVVLLLAASGIVLAQQTPMDPQSAPSSNPGWRRTSDSPASATPDQAAPDQPAPDPAPVGRDAYGQGQQPYANHPPAAPPQRPAYGLPNQVILKQRTLLTMRIVQKLADNKNSVGDTFSGPLMQPLVLDGIVVAQRGQMVYGRVIKAEKVKGVHFLGIAVTSLALVDGSQAAVETQLISRQSTILPYWSKERGAISTTAPGAPALVTKGHDSEIYPDTLLTFETTTNVAINTSNASAFHYVSPEDYSRPAGMTQTVAARPAYGPGFYGAPYPFWGYPYPFWGPMVGFGVGFGGFWGGGFRGRFR